MSKVMYNGNRLIPAPYVSINKTYQKSGNGDIIGKIYNITINGTLVANMGSPDSTGGFWTLAGYPSDEVIGNDSMLAAIQRKQEAIRNLFSTEGYQFEIQAADGSQAVKCNPRINDISFEEGQWYNRCNYTISLDCDELYPMQEDTFTEYVNAASEDWSINTNEEAETLGATRTYTITHSVSAVGKRFFDDTGTQIKPSWEYARDFVLGRLGFDSQIALSSGVLNLPSYYNGYNHTRNETTDKEGGGFSVQETWLLASGNAIEDFTIQQSDTLDTSYKNVSINGNIRGFEERDSDLGLSVNKWSNAQAKFVEASGLAYLRAKEYSDLDLNIVPMSFTIGRNPLVGTIDYTFEYNTRPLNLISGTRSEAIVISDNVGGQLFAQIFVLGRLDGPILDDLNTKPANTRNLSIELVVDPPTISNNDSSTIKDALINKKPSNDPVYSGAIQTVIDVANPTNSGFSTVFNNQPQESWDFRNGRYSYSIEWVYE